MRFGSSFSSASRWLIVPDVPPELAATTINSIEVLGALRAAAGVKAVLAERTVCGER